MPSSAKPDYKALAAVPVDQYNALGKLVNSFDSITQAARANKLTASQILRTLPSVAGNSRYSTGGYYWRRKGEALGNVCDIPTRGADRVRVRLCREGERPRVFASQSHAARFLKVPPAFVCQALKRRNGKCCDYEVSHVV